VGDDLAVGARGQREEPAELFFDGVGVQDLDAGLAGVDERVPQPGECVRGEAFIGQQQPPATGPGSFLRPRRPRTSRVACWRTSVSIVLASCTRWNRSATRTASGRVSVTALA